MTPFTGLWHSRDILSNGGVQANELKVTMIGGGNADLTTQANRVDVFSGNAFFLSDLSTVRFNNLGDLNLAHSEMGNGRLFVA
ncbi:hypothetical protein ACE40V_24590, partial [Salmonella enterica]|uniref:hypothetical protein n=1 Tax=Salmonella enterica TaxID=28901 RepID=UPI003D2D3038